MTNPPDWVELNRDRCEAIAAAVYRGACTTAHTHQRALAASLRVFAEARDSIFVEHHFEKYPTERMVRQIPRALYEELTGELTDEAFASAH
ncbi:hypothetical protein AQ938_06920 [Burkholderia pseudomallei]|uniref:hypothetical protein n=1 Tax=Burkholderia pseudomallei TaxID=28450 RepID=UPI000055B598|nr:hypothetical protein [Burkholderia pseudomallei]AJX60697.1 hypothetical protein DP47_3382 [Burkholderia pseudomallei Pasteur 52237]EDO95560.1 hypothetical protein BURPSPAST_C1346 [Burkholderia pseudomallei Pasteur 52237]MWA16578.1 hypothetical protein [Burkholderia pseudomallei]OND79004.1 hypothetical protein AQ938_06920 [Burkholderia pseudomallei]VBQ80976.1 Uncharacterised protein [Burkholderia pseudomallei]